jgi:hypothetical protein
VLTLRKKYFNGEGKVVEGILHTLSTNQSSVLFRFMFQFFLKTFQRYKHPINQIGWLQQ